MLRKVFYSTFLNFYINNKSKRYSYFMKFHINEMARNISHRTIDRKLWLSVASLYSRSKGDTSNIRPMTRWTKDELLNRYVSGLIISKSECPLTAGDIDNNSFPLYGKRFIELGGTINDIKRLYNINTGTTSIDNTEDEKDYPSYDETESDKSLSIQDDNVKVDKPLFKASILWMREKYAEMNKQLFQNKLGDCKFEIFTTGEGSQGGTLGWFKISARGIYVNRYTRRMYRQIGSQKIDITSMNFVEEAKPVISLNGNYSGEEEIILGTLVHEMCHYYDYMYGICPKQAHGPSWKQIAQIISYRSNGRFSIKRLADAETMSNMVLDPEIQARNEKREKAKQSRVIQILIFTTTGDIRLVNATNQSLVTKVYNTHERSNFKGIDRIITTMDPTVIDILFPQYNSTMRTYRYFTVTDFYNKNIKDKIDYEYETIYEK